MPLPPPSQRPAAVRFTDVDVDVVPDTFVASSRMIGGSVVSSSEVNKETLQPASPIPELTGHMGSHSVTCHPAEVTSPPFTPVAEWLACWTQAQKGLGSNHSRDAVG